MENPYLRWARQQLGLGRADCVDPFHRAAGRQLLAPIGEGAIGREHPRQIMRAERRGGLLDHHLNETGYTQLISPGDQPKDLLRLTSEVHADPREVTVGVNVVEEVPAPANVAPDFLVQAIAQWGTGKGVSQAIFDVRHGAKLTLTADTVSLWVRYVGATGPGVRVSASIAYGTPQSARSALTFTELPIDVPAGTQSDPFRVPPYATRVAWFSDDAPLVAPIPAATIRQRSDQNLFALSRTTNQSASQPNTFVTLTNSADFIRLFNDSAAAHRYGLLYELHI